MKTLVLKGVEKWREYVFPEGDTYRIYKPTELRIADSGSHRVCDEAGVWHYVTPGWRAIRWDGDLIA